MSISSSDTKQMIEDMPINVLVCDAKDFTITYANQLSVETLNSIQDLLPDGVNGDTIVGQCIDVFHKAPAHQRQLLSAPENLPYSTIIRLGNRS